MRLLIISQMSHYQRGNQIVGWGPTVHEIDHLAQIFDEIRHIACLHVETAPSSALPYSSDRISLVPVPMVGGEGLLKKLDVLRLTPLFIRTILDELPKADVVHVRCPANISMLAIMLLALVRAPRVRWVKYAGNWRPDSKESWSYTFQRWWLKKGFHRGVVTINGQWPDQPSHIYSFLNPCLTDQELGQALAAASVKHLAPPIRLLFVGRLEAPKGVGRALHVLSHLQQKGISVKLDLVGDGPQRGEFERLADTLGVNQLVTFHGWLPRTVLAPLYSAAHLMILPSSASEGWPKVLSEAMAYGVVPVCSNISSIPQYLEKFGVGRMFEPDDVEGFACAIADYYSHPETWKRESEMGIKAARLFTYSNYKSSVRTILDIKNNELETSSIGESKTETLATPIISRNWT
jgi:glycosyltransferase involved in cell wall biosynthesis